MWSVASWTRTFPYGPCPKTWAEVAGFEGLGTTIERIWPYLPHSSLMSSTTCTQPDLNVALTYSIQCDDTSLVRVHGRHSLGTPARVMLRSKQGLHIVQTDYSQCIQSREFHEARMMVLLTSKYSSSSVSTSAVTMPTICRKGVAVKGGGAGRARVC